MGLTGSLRSRSLIFKATLNGDSGTVSRSPLHRRVRNRPRNFSGRTGARSLGGDTGSGPVLMSGRPHGVITHKPGYQSTVFQAEFHPCQLEMSPATIETDHGITVIVPPVHNRHAGHPAPSQDGSQRGARAITRDGDFGNGRISTWLGDRYASNHSTGNRR